MTSQGFPRRHPDSAFRAVGDEGGMVVLPGEREVKVLNPVGIKIFSLLDGAHSHDVISQAVAEEFDVSPDQARRDVDEFLAELESHGMLASAAGAAAEENG